MSVSVTKSGFNVREKLKQLQKPIGLKGSELMRAETAQEARDFVSAGRKNMVINGDMRIWQRANGGTVTASDVIYMDRFSCRDNTDGTLTIGSQASSTAGPSGESFRYVMKLDCDGADTSLSSAQYARIQQYIEGYNLNMDWGISNTDFITLSFWVKSNKPGIYCCGIEDGNVGRIYIKEYTINSSDVWQKVELTYPPPPAGTWKNFDNSTGLRITWCLGTGTTYQGSANSWGTTYVMATSRQTNFMDNANNAFYLTGVQLEVGRNATEFEHRSYGEELALCYRYYEKSGAQLWVNAIYANGSYVSSGNNTLFWKVQKRASPQFSLTFVSSIDNCNGVVSTVNSDTNSAIYNLGINNITYPYCRAVCTYVADSEL